jgi:hypothetical protein
MKPHDYLDDMEPESEEMMEAVRQETVLFREGISKYRSDLAAFALRVRFAYGPGSADAEEELLAAVDVYLHGLEEK